MPTAELERTEAEVPDWVIDTPRILYTLTANNTMRDDRPDQEIEVTVDEEFGLIGPPLFGAVMDSNGRNQFSFMR
jgi:hypothetical protein